MPLVIGHRGSAADVPENTIPSFEAAWAAGARWVEADTQPTADGVPVILHDPTLERTTTATGAVRERSSAELAAARIHGLPDQTVPELAALLASMMGTGSAERALMLELKGEHTTAQLTAVLETIRTHRCEDRVFLQSFDVPVLRRLAQLDPGRPFGLLVEQLDDDPVDRCRELAAVAYNPEYRAVLGRPGIVTELRDAGIAVAAWTADDPRAWEQLTAAGVDAIITNSPGSLVRWQAGRCSPT